MITLKSRNLKLLAVAAGLACGVTTVPVQVNAIVLPKIGGFPELIHLPPAPNLASLVHILTLPAPTPHIAVTPPKPAPALFNIVPPIHNITAAPMPVRVVQSITSLFHPVNTTAGSSFRVITAPGPSHFNFSAPTPVRTVTAVPVPSTVSSFHPPVNVPTAPAFTTPKINPGGVMIPVRSAVSAGGSSPETTSTIATGVTFLPSDIPVGGSTIFLIKPPSQVSPQIPPTSSSKQTVEVTTPVLLPPSPEQHPTLPELSAWSGVPSPGTSGGTSPTVENPPPLNGTAGDVQACTGVFGDTSTAAKSLSTFQNTPLSSPIKKVAAALNFSINALGVIGDVQSCYKIITPDTSGDASGNDRSAGTAGVPPTAITVTDDEDLDPAPALPKLSAPNRSTTIVPKPISSANVGRAADATNSAAIDTAAASHTTQPVLTSFAPIKHEPTSSPAPGAAASIEVKTPITSSLASMSIVPNTVHASVLEPNTNFAGVLGVTAPGATTFRVPSLQVTPSQSPENLTVASPVSEQQTIPNAIVGVPAKLRTASSIIGGLGSAISAGGSTLGNTAPDRILKSLSTGGLSPSEAQILEDAAKNGGTIEDLGNHLGDISVGIGGAQTVVDIADKNYTAAATSAASTAGGWAGAEAGAIACAPADVATAGLASVACGLIGGLAGSAAGGALVTAALHNAAPTTGVVHITDSTVTDVPSFITVSQVKTAKNTIGSDIAPGSISLSTGVGAASSVPAKDETIGSSSAPVALSTAQATHNSGTVAKTTTALDETVSSPPKFTVSVPSPTTKTSSSSLSSNASTTSSTPSKTTTNTALDETVSSDPKVSVSSPAVVATPISSSTGIVQTIENTATTAAKTVASDFSTAIRDLFKL